MNQQAKSSSMVEMSKATWQLTCFGRRADFWSLLFFLFACIQSSSVFIANVERDGLILHFKRYGLTVEVELIG